MKSVMKKRFKAVAILAVCALVSTLASLGQQPESTLGAHANASLKDRWFFSFGYERNRKDVEKIKSLIDVGAAHGLNGMVLSSFDMDSVTQWSEKDIALLKEIAAYCAEKQVELIPTGFTVGYGGGALGFNRNFAAALPTTIDLTVKNEEICPVSADNLLKNGDLEEHVGDRFSGSWFHDKPGEVSFADTRVASGNTSIRFEHFGDFKHGHGRINQEVTITPGRSYRLTFKIKTEDIQPVSGLKAMVYVEDRALAEIHPKMKPTQDWTEVTLDYVNQDQEDVLIYIGIWEGKTGAFWLDDITFKEYGDLADIVRRPGTPMVLNSKDRDRVFVEGKDFGEIRCLGKPEPVLVLPGSSMQEGEALELSCYKIPYVRHSWGKQISLCMSNPDLYAYWEKEARALHQIIPFKRLLLSMDEIRNGGGCLLCRNSGKSMGEILGDCITRQHAIFKSIDPEIEVMIWSDMLDPAHNAHNDYYGVVGDFTGSWKHVPKDLTIMCWYHEIRDQSLEFFSRQGFRTFGAAYYDADDLTNPRDWLSSLNRTSNAQGIIYTTWEKKYRLLAGFGDLVTADRVPMIEP